MTIASQADQVLDHLRRWAAMRLRRRDDGCGHWCPWRTLQIRFGTKAGPALRALIADGLAEGYGRGRNRQVRATAKGMAR